MRRGTDYNILVDIPPEAHRCSDDRVYVVLDKMRRMSSTIRMTGMAWQGCQRYTDASKQHI